MSLGDLAVPRKEGGEAAKRIGTNAGLRLGFHEHIAVVAARAAQSPAGQAAGYRDRA